MLQLQGCEGAFNFPTIIAGNVQSPQALGGMQQLGNALAHTHTHTERPSANANATWVRATIPLKPARKSGCRRRSPRLPPELV